MRYSYGLYKSDLDIIDFSTKAPGKDWKDMLRGLSYTEDGVTYFKFKDLWKYMLRTKN